MQALVAIKTTYGNKYRDLIFYIAVFVVVQRILITIG